MTRDHRDLPGRIPNVLSIAGSDPSGGAGIQADLKTVSSLGCYGMAVITALTAQNTTGVTGIHVPPAEFLGAQIDDIFTDIAVDAVKIGMLATGDLARTVASRLKSRKTLPVVLDPVLVATSGDALGSPDVVDALRDLMPLVTVITPNLAEAARLADCARPETLPDMQRIAETLQARGARAVLIKGGHLAGEDATDLLFDGRSHRSFAAPRIRTANTHGTGCTLSSAIASFLAQGADLAASVAAAKRYLSGALQRSGDLTVGRGHGPVHHFHAVWPRQSVEDR